MKKKIKGFSLVELMVTLIIVSMLVAALAPVITKKLKSSAVTVGSFNSNISNIEMDCSLFGEKCSLCDSVKCISCSEICEYNQALNIQECACKDCSDLFGENCKQCSINACSLCEKGNYITGGKCVECEAGYKCDGITRTQCQDGYYALAGAGECEKCSENCANCEKDTGKCLACEANFKLEEDLCVADSCGDLAEIIELDGKKYCFTKFNIGDKEDLPISPTTTVVSVSSSSCAGGNGAATQCCWQGINSSKTCYSDEELYLNCNRTLCNYNAAVAACTNLKYKNLSWRLPSKAEWTSIVNNIGNLTNAEGTYGIQLCSRTYCEGKAVCNGSYEKGCFACRYWGSEYQATGRGINFRYYSSPSVTLDETEDADSVRCIADL